ncbi:DNA topoisomerase-1 [Lachnospiraceae bacterium NE2001]|nr:DNA topoisomerase-1 [Lachnospiraceae bacterium NE2001]
MAKNLVIVESPTKAKTIKKYLGKNYEVIASEGHIRDLPKSSMGIDIENDYEPHYITIRGKGELLSTLKKAVKKSDFVYLATDPDREGEAISYHLSVALKLEDKKFKRISFNEITKSAVSASIKNAREIDMDLVDAQQARRVVDRLVGYEISPLLWEKLGKKSLSAGRVQSVALKMISDREKEIDAFIPTEYWSLDALLTVPGQKKSASFTFKGDISNAKEADALKKKLEGADFVVTDIKTSSRTQKAPMPFTTSTLQQTASSRLNFSTSKTMRVAQQLYEGVEIKGKGTVGLITYLRTDSTRISDEADALAREHIRRVFGPEYEAEVTEPAKETKKNIQDAHEAIRPTDVEITPASLKGNVSNEQYKLYKLIYERFVASRMKPAQYSIFTVTVTAAGETLKASTSSITFAGYQNIYSTEEDKAKAGVNLSGIKKDDKLSLDKIETVQHFTEPPSHYTESLLVRTMEENGIGRPSTYAPTISTLITRRYVVKEQKNLYITELGEAVNNVMENAFPEIVDVEFTANMESLLDSIGEGAIQWKVVVRNFYPDLENEINHAQENLEKIKIADEVSEETCEECGARMVIKYGAYGKFLACPNFPNCRFTMPYYEKIGVSCPECGGDLVKKITRKGRPFYGCINYPDCEFTSWNRPATQKCPRCGKYMIMKGKKTVCSDKECGYSE